MIREFLWFLSYKRSDGLEFAHWIYDKIQGKGFCVNSNSFISSVQFDHTFPGGINWKNYIEEQLSKTHALIIVCSPSSVLKNSNGEDWFYHEIEWWIKNRPNIPPVLMSTKGYNENDIPKIIKDKWNDLQVIKIDLNATNIGSIIEKIYRSTLNSKLNVEHYTNPIIKTSFISERPGVYAWAKDRHHKYIYANEAYARAAGYDSPKSMYGKTDMNMPWRSLATFFQEGDAEIMFNNELKRITVFEKEIMVDKIVDIIVNELPLKDSSGKVIGVSGCFFEVGDIQKNKAELKITNNGIFLGKDFDNVYFENIEIKVFRGMVKNMNKAKIASQLNLNINQVKDVIKSIQKKLQCSNESDIINAAVRQGLPLKLFS